jgi:hypothetical protein
MQPVPLEVRHLREPERAAAGAGLVDRLGDLGRRAGDAVEERAAAGERRSGGEQQ